MRFFRFFFLFFVGCLLLSAVIFLSFLFFADNITSTKNLVVDNNLNLETQTSFDIADTEDSLLDDNLNLETESSLSLLQQAGQCDNTKRNACTVGTVNIESRLLTEGEWLWRCDGTGGGAQSKQCSVNRLSVRHTPDELQQEIHAVPSRVPYDDFGHSVSVDGDTAIVGAPGTSAEYGAVHVFTRIRGGWSHQQKITVSDGFHSHFDARLPGSAVGKSVDIDGDTVIAGANGAAYIFTHSGNSWSQQQKIVASDGGRNDQFGFSVAIDGNTAIVGARDHGKEYEGAAYIFTKIGTTWSQQQKIQASDKATRDYFGSSVAIDGETAIVGAHRKNQEVDGNDKRYDTGSAYIFTRVSNSWSQQQKIVASDRSRDDQFGFSVDIDGDTAVVGTCTKRQEMDGTPVGLGSAYIFTRSENSWSQQQKIVAGDRDTSGRDGFGCSVAVDGDIVVVGAQYMDDNGNSKKSNIAGDRTINDADGFDQSVVDRDTAWVSALHEDKDKKNRKTNAGVAYIFTRTGTAWTQRKKIMAPFSEQYDRFGKSIALSGDTAIVGAKGRSSRGGMAYIFAPFDGVCDTC